MQDIFDRVLGNFTPTTEAEELVRVPRHRMASKLEVAYVREDGSVTKDRVWEAQPGDVVHYDSRKRRRQNRRNVQAQINKGTKAAMRMARKRQYALNNAIGMQQVATREVDAPEALVQNTLRHVWKLDPVGAAAHGLEYPEAM